MKAVWHNAVLAQSTNTIVVEGNHYFPIESVNADYLKKSDHHTNCPWKGEASYYDVAVGGNINPDAAWYYPQPTEAAKQIKNYVAFWKGVEVLE